MHRRNLLVILSAMVAWLFAGLAMAGPRAIVDDAGRKVELPETINRVMAAGPPASVLIYALAPEKMVGWVREPSAEEKTFIAPAYRDLPVHGRLTGKGNTANLEAVLAMKPDVIIDVGTIDDTYASLADRVQQQTGIPYVLIDGRFAKTAESLRKAGDIVGAKDQAEKLADYAEKAVSRLNGVIDAVPADKRARVYYGRGPEGLETGLAGSINMEILAIAGARNVAEAAGSGGLANVSLEQVLSWNPDVILALDPKFQKSVLADPQWSGVAAVRDKRVYRAPTVPFGWFDSPPGVNRVVGLAWLAKVLYPDVTNIDLGSDVRDFYKLFYHVDLTQAQIDTLLAHSAPPAK
ncbi:iron ABC transporter substrate-binding protein [Pseudaminobacter soli (ex Li et al. 2025)]|uniref:Iron ABC transporter substrate-binding protein n=1 Tax=Pseudaminobacter soli (ex Li et al. 2025) TaxID=1295366 RepID=A0A2P7SMF0_9HYPH|nr:iron ABC transporter substrate-binding protein [Mesorhizobium soli]PSJ63581.1 iron ABC transporter substrate-binding protein [Mesorhizobium soli]